MLFVLLILIEQIDHAYPWKKKQPPAARFAYGLQNILLKGYQKILMTEEFFRHLFHISGVRKNKRETSLLISLTSVESRLPWLQITLASLMRQSVKPDRILLFLHEDVRKIPKTVLAFRRRGLQIVRVKGEDTRSYKKVIPALKKFPNASVVTADDDLMYPRNWLKNLYAAYQKEPMYIHCHRAHKIARKKSGQPMQYLDWELTSPNFQGPSPDLFATHGAGALLRVDFFHKEVFNQEQFLKLAPYADDVWLHAMARMNGTEVKKVMPYSSPLLYSHRADGQAVGEAENLFERNVLKKMNDVQMRAVARQYPLLKNN